MSKFGFQQEAVQSLLDIAVECVLMDDRQYEDFKTDALQSCEEKAKPFLRWVLSIIDAERREG